MAETAYAALVSLTHVIENVLSPVRGRILVGRKQFKPLHKKVTSLLSFVEDLSQSTNKLDTDGLEIQVADACYAAEDIIESYVVDNIRPRATGEKSRSFKSFCKQIQEVIAKMDFLEKKIERIGEKMGVAKDDRQPMYSSQAGGLVGSSPRGKSSMVGFDDHLVLIMDRLTGQESKLDMVSIVGMGGIGKTTLARNVYANSYIEHHFPFRAWVTISQEYSVREILLALLHDLENCCDGRKLERSGTLAAFRDGMVQKSEQQLGEKLYKSLFGRKYLIVMDDMWTTKAWDEVRMFLPDNCNGSRVMVTTRLSNVALRFGSWGPHEMNFLDEDKSWILLCEKVFPGGHCPIELEDTGKRIARNCRGLPLAIVVIGGLLAKSNQTREYWEYVSENLNSIVNSGVDEHCYKLLYLSYTQLPIHLKPCFLYMAIFPKDHEIRISRLIKLWVAEGFVKPVKSKSLEDVAKKYLKDLIERNLILVCRRGTTGKAKSCVIHDLLRDLCLREAQRQNFLCVTRIDSSGGPPSIESQRRIGVHRGSTKGGKHCPQLINDLQSASVARSLVCKFEWISPLLASHLSLLRVLDVVDKYSPEEILKLVNLRYLALTGDWNMTSSITYSALCLCWNLQTLIVPSSHSEVLPREIWEMCHLRNLEFTNVVLPHPPQSFHVLENLQTMFTIENFRCTDDVVKRVPNLKKLKITYKELDSGTEWLYYCLNNLASLHNLESLTCRLCDKISVGQIAFPHSLKKLALNGCHLPWQDITLVGSLPNLEILKLEHYAYEGPEWDVIQGGFLKLKFLLISDTDLMYWRAESDHFPCLEQLVLDDLQLQDIPLCLAELPNLGTIQLIHCCDSVVTSAKQILEERESLGYEGLQVQVRTWNGGSINIELGNS